MDLQFIIATLDIVGKIFLALAALSVHHRFLNEHKIDGRVFQSMKFEQKLGILGVFLMVVSYALEVTLL